ncbi:Cysteine/Histidine-rich C1 domain family protein [Raphanus sativus]|nr:Cysteine/Histidine-rich C1 domain family protein [Raphanus sativus]
MEELQHCSHECALTSSETVASSICNICNKDELVKFTCKPCNFDLCEACSKLPSSVSHDFHPDHPLVLCQRKYDKKPARVVCSGCGNMSSGSFYKCKECEIYLDLDCALMENIIKGWDAKELLHDSHAHLLTRCRPGHGDARGSCLLYCNLHIHLRCADTLLRGLMHKSHRHRLFYVSSTDASGVFGRNNPCQICKGACMMSLNSYYHCVECGLKFHFECLRIPKSVLKKSHHIHPLVCKKFIAEEDDSLEYCGVCETKLHRGHHVYSCNECGFLGHIECILNEKAPPSPLRLKDLYSNDNDKEGPPANGGDFEVKQLENKLMVTGIEHIHVMRPVSMSELDGPLKCHICKENIRGGSPFKCEICDFQAHQFCADLGRQSTHPLHSNHLLILLPKLPARALRMDCDICKEEIYGFSLFCRICSFVIGINLNY